MYFGEANKTKVETNQSDHRDQRNPLRQIFIPLVRCQETAPIKDNGKTWPGPQFAAMVHCATLAYLGLIGSAGVKGEESARRTSVYTLTAFGSRDSVLGCST
jgi:hypothetical protein